MIRTLAFAADYEILAGRLDEELRLASLPAADLFAKIIGGICSRIPLLGKSGKTGRIERLLEVGAFADAALALLELELPAWALRRTVYEGGEWQCSLSRHPNLPLEFDDMIEARHEKLPLAILRAFVEAKSRNEPAKTSGELRLAHGRAEAVCCDNFS